jgi:hypothetical protein
MSAFLRDTRVRAVQWLDHATTLVEPSPEYDAWLREGPHLVGSLLAALQNDEAFKDFQVPDPLRWRKPFDGAEA